MRSSAPVRLKYVKLRRTYSNYTKTILVIVAMLLQRGFQRGSLCAAIGVVRWTAHNAGIVDLTTAKREMSTFATRQYGCERVCSAYEGFRVQVAMFVSFCGTPH